MTRIAAEGDPGRTMRLLWGAGAAPVPQRGPKPTLSLEGIVEAAIEIADGAADADVSLRAVAARLGCTPMALYTYVADRRELLDVMYDRVHAELEAPEGDGWTTRTTAWARAMLELHVRHPWVAEVSYARAVLGPHEQRTLELLLDALAPAQLRPEATAAVVAALHGLARSMASTVADARRTAAATDERAWWVARTTALAEAAPDFATRFPSSAALGGTLGTDAWKATDEASTPSTPWLEPGTRDAFDHAVEMLLAGAASTVERA